MSKPKSGFLSSEFWIKATLILAGAFLVWTNSLDAPYYWTGACALAGIYGIERTIQKRNGGPK